MSNERKTISNRQLGHLAMLLFAILIAGSFSLGKLATPYISPGPLNSIRFVLATIIVGFVTFIWHKNPIGLPSRPWRFLVFGGLLATYFITMFMALETTSPIATSAVFTLTPVLSAIVAFGLLRQIVRPVVALSLVFAALGSIWVIFGGSFIALRAFNIGTGEKTFFVGAVAYAFYAPLFKKWRGPEPLLVQTFWVLLAASIFLTLLSLPDFPKMTPLNMPLIAWGAILYLAIFTTAITNSLLQFAAVYLPAAKVMAYVYLTPVIVIILEGVSGHGWAGLSVLLGALVIVLGLVVLYFLPDQ